VLFEAESKQSNNQEGLNRCRRSYLSQKSFRPKDGSGDDDDGANFHGQKRKNDTHASGSRSSLETAFGRAFCLLLKQHLPRR
jgi:hypothetical protein